MLVNPDKAYQLQANLGNSSLAYEHNLPVDKETACIPLLWSIMFTKDVSDGSGYYGTQTVQQ